VIFKRLRRRVAEIISPPSYLHVQINARGYAVLDDANNTAMHRGKTEDCAMCFYGKGIRK
jgi:hypothetical protein